MKLRFSVFIFIAFYSFSFSQNIGINYKALVKDGEGDVLANQSITVQFQVLKGDGMANVYQETHSSTTDGNGYVILVIGEGVADNGVFSDIEWGSENHHLNVQIDTGGGFVDIGAIQFMAVPYALNANVANNVTGLEVIDEGNGTGWRLIGKNPSNYGNIGLNATDISNSINSSTAFGAIGNYSLASGFETTATGYYSTAMGRNTIASGSYSTAMGQNTTASGNSSTAMNGYNTASGHYSFAMGNSTLASAWNSTAMNLGTKAEAYSSTAIGRYNVGGGTGDSWVSTEPLFEIGNGTHSVNRSNAFTVLKNGTITAPSLTNALIDGAGAKALTTKEYVDTHVANNITDNVTGLEAIDEGNGTGWRLIGKNPSNYGNIGLNAIDLSNSLNSSTTFGAIGNYSLASGYETTASGWYSTAMGRNTTASGSNSTAMGTNTTAYGSSSIAMNGYNTASGAYSTAMGNSTLASGSYSTAMNIGTNAEAYSSTAVGRYNVGGGTANNWVSTEHLFEIGNGTHSANRSNALTVLKNGNTSIGINNPGSHRLYVQSPGSGVSGSTGYFKNTSTSGLAMIIENSSSGSTDNALLVSTQGTGDIASFDSWQGTGSWNRRFKFTNAGDGRCDGGWYGGGADYAEFFPKANPNLHYEPGDVIAISPSVEYSVTAANNSHADLILGVYSTNPVVVGNSTAEEDPEDAVLVGLMGVVDTKVNSENGAIKIGDFLTISSSEGVASKAIESGYVIGRALENYSSNGQGLIKVLVKPEWMTIDAKISVLEAEIARQNKTIESLINRVEQLEFFNKQ